ncbi:MAG TPA: cysteine--tRNA ligase [Candidatus Limnocylindrales bacterium]|nr:cysteine--tRNA ligase [Candidatus Limnocylindrales bacterium]
MSTLRLYSTLSGRVEELVPLEPGHVRMYTCGPTVHNFSHVGNFRTFLFEDLLRRVIQEQGLRVTQVMNLTDVEDRIIAKSQAAGKTIEEFTEPFIAAFMEDLQTLRVQPAEHYPRATHHIKDMVTLIQRLQAGGHTYEVDGSHYFRIASFPAYGRLSRLDTREIKSGARVDVDEYGKDDPRDFVLWKARKPGEHFWPTELGPGRPGWHIECSAMSMRYLGESFDLHAGAVDLIFPHHEDEIAQSEAATGKPFARIWTHAEHLRDSMGEKMAKRAGNFVTLRDLVEEGYEPRVIRYALLTGAHWRTPLNFSPELLHAAGSAVKRLDEFAVRLQAPGPAVAPPADIQRLWDEALRDDLNLPGAVGHLFEFVRAFNLRLDSDGPSAEERGAALGMLRHANRVLDVITFPDAGVDEEINQLIAERNAARARKDFKRSDEIRRQLLERGIQLDDTKDGTIWKRVR